MKIARIIESEKPLEIVQVADLKPLGTEVDFGVSHRFSFPEEHPGHLPTSDPWIYQD